MADLQKLIADGVAESLTLDYKASSSLGKDSKQRDELCKDVTAFANSAGGQIVYGVEEDKNLPTKLDDGADPSITKEWIEQVIPVSGTKREPRSLSPRHQAPGKGHAGDHSFASGSVPNWTALFLG